MNISINYRQTSQNLEVPSIDTAGLMDRLSNLAEQGVDMGSFESFMAVESLLGLLTSSLRQSNHSFDQGSNAVESLYLRWSDQELSPLQQAIQQFAGQDGRFSLEEFEQFAQQVLGLETKAANDIFGSLSAQSTQAQAAGCPFAHSVQPRLE
jgi:hypothetical protein